MRRKGQLVWSELIPWIIGFGVLVLGIIIYFSLSEKGKAAIVALRRIGGLE